MTSFSQPELEQMGREVAAITQLCTQLISSVKRHGLTVVVNSMKAKLANATGPDDDAQIALYHAGLLDSYLTGACVTRWHWTQVE